MICFIIPHDEKFATVIDGVLIGSSKHKDYSVFHWKARDVQVLKKHPITKFIFADRDGGVAEVIDSAAMEGRGFNYATAKRNTDALSDVEVRNLGQAVALVAGLGASDSDSKPTSATDADKNTSEKGADQGDAGVSAMDEGPGNDVETAPTTDVEAQTEDHSSEQNLIAKYSDDPAKTSAKSGKAKRRR